MTRELREVSRMTEPQHWRRIARWVARQPAYAFHLVPAHLDLTDTMRKRLREHIDESVEWPFPRSGYTQFQTYIIMRCELLALEAEEEGR